MSGDGGFRSRSSAVGHDMLFRSATTQFEISEPSTVAVTSVPGVTFVRPASAKAPIPPSFVRSPTREPSSVLVADGVQLGTE